uniref:Uncharacterized protein n=1 Tax=Amblyomma americanum TaxID=6943 RepID=A0A0C9R4K1_AMBAM
MSICLLSLLCELFFFFFTFLFFFLLVDVADQFLFCVPFVTLISMFTSCSFLSYSRLRYLLLFFFRNSKLCTRLFTPAKVENSFSSLNFLQLEKQSTGGFAYCQLVDMSNAWPCVTTW